MALVHLQELLDAGVHFGHRVSRWDPRMAPYIFGRKNEIHILDLRETVKGLAQGCHFLEKMGAEGQEILLVGTKRQANSVILEEARRVECPYVIERWLGGTLTNFLTVRSRLRRLEELEKLESTPSSAQLSKKVLATLARERRKIRRNLDGIRRMDRLPGALVVVDPRREKNAVHEANRLGIPVVALTDTDSNPTVVDYVVPGNDDAMKSIRVLLGKLLDAYLKGRRKLKAQRGSFGDSGSAGSPAVLPPTAPAPPSTTPPVTASA
ncbi:MAG: 30S ribosomal protein S2 [Planctomycetales bacterium]|nr:30S ribosomal protein S2 [Planctomycetales bacterium]